MTTTRTVFVIRNKDWRRLERGIVRTVNKGVRTVNKGDRIAHRLEAA